MHPAPGQVLPPGQPSHFQHSKQRRCPCGGLQLAPSILQRLLRLHAREGVCDRQTRQRMGMTWPVYFSTCSLDLSCMCNIQWCTCRCAVAPRRRKPPRRPLLYLLGLWRPGSCACLPPMQPRSSCCWCAPCCPACSAADSTILCLTEACCLIACWAQGEAAAAAAAANAAISVATACVAVCTCCSCAHHVILGWNLPLVACYLDK